MSTSAALADKATKLFGALCAGVTVVGVTSLVVNVYYNTGRHRKPMPPSLDGIEGSLPEEPADAAATE